MPMPRTALLRACERQTAHPRTRKHRAKHLLQVRAGCRAYAVRKLRGSSAGGELHPCPLQYITTMTKEEKNDARFKRLTAFRKERPIEFALMRIGLKWDELNGEFEKNGKTANFHFLLSDLKSLIERFLPIIGESRLSDFRNANPSVYDRRGKLVKHGYTFNYHNR